MGKAWSGGKDCSESPPIEQGLPSSIDVKGSVVHHAQNEEALSKRQRAERLARAAAELAQPSAFAPRACSAPHQQQPQRRRRVAGVGQQQP